MQLLQAEVQIFETVGMIL